MWFDDQAEAAAEFYTGIFRNSRITKVTRYGSVRSPHQGSCDNTQLGNRSQVCRALPVSVRMLPNKPFETDLRKRLRPLARPLNGDVRALNG